MDEVISLVNKLGSAGFATLLAVILYASWKEIWVWGRDVTRLEARYEALLSKAEEETKWWRELATKATGIAELQGTVARELAAKTAATSEKK